MAAYRANGAQLGWLLIPDQQAVEVWRASNGPAAEHLEPPVARLADPLLFGLHLELVELWAA
ncbi:MAG: hypothetical protein ACKO45_01770 [Cyanobium sp.]